MDERYDMMRNLGKDWMVRPLQLVSDQDLVLEPGVTITAQRGAYRGGGDSILNAVELFASAKRVSAQRMFR